MKNDELISIIIPVYNCEQYLKMCLESVIKQSYTNLDIIIIDDGSTDNSGYICDLYSSKDTRIRVVHKVNEGQGVARNIGYKLSKGKFIVYIDGDDIVNERLIEILVDIYHKSNVDIVSTMLLEFNREVPDVQIINNPKVNYINKYEIMRGFIEDYGYLFHVVCGKLIKRNYLKISVFQIRELLKMSFFK
ncbi:glycosyltransferase family 2 protein [Coprobacillaceae bacterium CR2/5/TPMF4]|nr:glycosyltransferase family 2 protein [Coprobacillaceae bacterium CR2/5/TPMF4]